MKACRDPKWAAVYIVTWLLCMAAAFYFCTQKSGFHSDEYYSYYSTELTKGLNLPDGGWMTHDDYYDEFIVMPGEGFRYGLVKQIQSWDVHPPVYYWVLHTVSSLFQGTFSKWTGLGINLAFHGLSLWLLWYLTVLMGASAYPENNMLRDFIPALVMAAWGLSPAGISEVTFIRMYAMLTALVLLAAVLHVRQMMRSQELKLPVMEFTLPLAALTYVGFLTHYYFAVFMFFMAMFFWIWCLYMLNKGYDRHQKGFVFGAVIQYPLIIIVPLILGYLTYPSCLGQIFHGQRGAQAIGNFADMSNTISRIKYFGDILNSQAFGGLLYIWLMLALLLFAAAKVQHVQTTAAGSGRMVCIMIPAAAAGYFLVTSKTGLMTGTQSVRYLMPICGMAVMLVIIYLTHVSDTLGMRVSTAAITAAFIALDVIGLSRGDVQFLYTEDREQTAFAQENAGSPVVYLYDSGAKWCVWDSADEFFKYPRVYFADIASDRVIDDPEIDKASSLVVYVNKQDDEQPALNRILSSNSSLSGYEKQYSDTYCDVYIFR